MAGTMGFELVNPPQEMDFPRSQAPQAYAPIKSGSAPFQVLILTRPGAL